MNEMEQILNKVEEMGVKLKNAKTDKEKARIISDVVLLTIVATTTHEIWKEADSVLVEVKLPTECTKLFEEINKRYGASITEMESNLIDLIVSFGLPHFATTVLEKMGIKPTSE